MAEPVMILGKALRKARRVWQARTLTGWLSVLLLTLLACMVHPRFSGGKPAMFICGNDEAAKKTVSGILDQFGWETADMGEAEAARAIEPLCMLWCIPGFLKNDWKHAFKLLT
jgi:hypothetical protein